MTLYFTFGYQHCHPVTNERMKDYWVEITGAGFDRAEEIMNQIYGENWASSYIENAFNKEYFPKGCYQKIEVDATGEMIVGYTPTIPPIPNQQYPQWQCCCELRQKEIREEIRKFISLTRGENMKLEGQVCSLDLAKRLKELGIKQDSLFYYRAWENPLIGHVSSETVNDEYWALYYHDDKYSKSCDWEISAFTSSELIELLPKKISDKDFLNIAPLADGYHYTWCVSYETDEKNCLKFVSDHVLVDALALMLIYLLQNKMI